MFTYLVVKASFKNKKTMKTLLSVCTVVCLFLFSCKEPTKPKANIFVTDENGVALRDARVVLNCVPSQDAINTQECKDGIQQEGSTDASGKVTFTTELPAVLRADVTYTIVQGVTFDSLKGDAFVEFKEDEITSQTIIVYP